MTDENEITERTPFIKMFLIVDKLQQRLLSTSTQSQVALVESLTKRQEKLLLAVSRMNRAKPEGVTLTELAKRLNMTVPATSVLVESMVRNDLLTRVPSPTDRRAVWIKLSAQGREIFENCCKQVQRYTESLMEGLTPEQKTSFEGIIQHFYDQVFGAEEKSEHVT